MKIKKSKIFLINILVIFLLIIFCNVLTYIIYGKIEQRRVNSTCFFQNIYNHIIKPNIYYKDIENFYYKKVRMPDGLEYLNKEKSPIILFGCSYTYGDGINKNQTFSYKLAHMIKRTVYNRGISGGSPQYMYYQVTQDAFYEQVPKSDTVIYILINDHYRRMLTRFLNITTQHIYIHYFMRNNKLVIDNYNNLFINALNSNYIYRYFKAKNTEKYIKNPNNKDELTDNMLLYFTESRNELEKHWNNKINLVVIFYHDRNIYESQLLKQKLKDNNIIVIDSQDITNENLLDFKYKTYDYYHPNEAAWDLLTPFIVKELKNNNVL